MASAPQAENIRLTLQDTTQHRVSLFNHDAGTIRCKFNNIGPWDGSVIQLRLKRIKQCLPRGDVADLHSEETCGCLSNNTIPESDNYSKIFFVEVIVSSITEDAEWLALAGLCHLLINCGSCRSDCFLHHRGC